MQTVYNEETTATPSIEKSNFFRMDDNIEPHDFNTVLITASRTVDDEEMLHITQLVGYIWKTIVKGTESFEPEYRISPWSFTVPVSLTASNSHDPVGRFHEFVDTVNDFIREGSPTRQDGTRLVEGIDDITIEIFVDSVKETVSDEYVSDELEDTPKLDKLASTPSVFQNTPVNNFEAELKAMATIKDAFSPREQYIFSLATELLDENKALRATLNTGSNFSEK